MKAHRTRTLAAGVALALSATLTACGQLQSDEAARVGDQVVSESDVKTASRELAGVQLPQPTDPQTITQLLVLGPILKNNLAQAGVAIGADQARSILPDPKIDLSEPSVDALSAMAGIEVLKQASQAAGQPGSPTSSMAGKVVAAGDQTSKQLQQIVTSGSLVANPKYVRQQNDWVQQPLTQQDAQPQAPRQQ